MIFFTLSHVSKSQFTTGTFSTRCVWQNVMGNNLKQLTWIKMSVRSCEPLNKLNIAFKFFANSQPLPFTRLNTKLKCSRYHMEPTWSSIKKFVFPLIIQGLSNFYKGYPLKALSFIQMEVPILHSITLFLYIFSTWEIEKSWVVSLFQKQMCISICCYWTLWFKLFCNYQISFIITQTSHYTNRMDTLIIWFNSSCIKKVKR